MKIHGTIYVGKRKYVKGDDIPWFRIYPFFLLHMLIFGGSSVFMAYAVSPPSLFILYVYGGGGILAYTVFYLTIFGRDEVKWMFINAALAVFGICSQIGWLLSLLGKQVGDYPFYIHVIPFLYFVLYTFLLRQAVIDIVGAREDGTHRRLLDSGYIIVTASFYLLSALSQGSLS